MMVKVSARWRGPLRISTRVPPQYLEGGRESYPIITLNDREANRAKDFPENSIYTTKYTLFSFIPKLLWEQFRKATSFYFLLICFIASIRSVSPINPASSWAGLFFILLVAAIREAYEDWLRFQADVVVNSNEATKLDSATGLEKQVASFEIEVGDILYLKQDSRIPVDLLILKTSMKDGTAFMETAQLDGETNLKLRSSPSDFVYKMTKGDLCKMRGTLEAECPNHDLYSFKGSLKVQGAPMDISTDEKNLLLTGATLRNTEWVIGLVVYAGPESKLGLNLKLPPSKFSSLDKKLNRYILSIFCFKLLLVIMLTFVQMFFNVSDAAVLQDLVDSESSYGFMTVKAFLTYFVLLNYLIPLSLVVTLDIVRFLQATMIEWDASFYHDSKDATATTSNLNDELALVDYVFSDKTGTLTENVMEFKLASINGVIHEDSHGRGDLRKLLDYPPDPQTKKFVSKYLYTLGLAHSCQTDTDKSGKMIYKSASPDEEALSDAARQNGFVFLGREGNYIVTDIRGKKKKFELLVEMEFTSDRKRMSVIVRTPKNKIFLYSKGADQEMTGRITKDQVNGDRLVRTNKDLSEFSVQGLRTLILAFKPMSRVEYDTFFKEYNAAANLINGREVAIDKVCDRIERDLTLIGATAIEDKLQEGVPRTIFNLRRAAIKVWVITGDKEETAINIGYSSNLLSNEMSVEIVRADDSYECGKVIEKLEQKYGGGLTTKPFAFVINGQVLKIIIKHHAAAFMRVAQYCTSVVCNRVSPLQKAEVVKMVQDNFEVVCLSIGDGGNDVSMIQQAHLGIGIKGREGSQAARAADFAIPKFRDLEKLLFIHGRYSLLRNTKVIYASFYKNATMFLCNVYFAFYSGASGQPLFDDWVMTFYNILFTALPILVIGIFEKDLEEYIVAKNPPIYRSQKNLSYGGLISWMGYSVLHSSMIWWTSYAIYNDGFMLSDGKIAGMYSFGIMLMSIGLPVIYCKLLLETSYVRVITQLILDSNWILPWTPFLTILSWLSYYFVIGIESDLPESIPTQYKVVPHILGSAVPWFASILCIVLCLLPDITFKFVSRQVDPKAWHILQEKYVDTDLSDKVAYGVDEDDDTKNVPLLEDTVY